jgi:hypothetical protein
MPHRIHATASLRSYLMERTSVDSERRWYVMLGGTSIQIIQTSETHATKMVENGWVRANSIFNDEAAAIEYANAWESKGLTLLDIR